MSKRKEMYRGELNVLAGATVYANKIVQIDKDCNYKFVKYKILGSANYWEKRIIFEVADGSAVIGQDYPTPSTKAVVIHHLNAQPDVLERAVELAETIALPGIPIWIFNGTESSYPWIGTPDLEAEEKYLKKVEELAEIC